MRSPRRYEEEYPHPYDTSRCNIDRIPYDQMTPTLFHSEYYITKPFILTPTPSTARTTLATRQAWSRASILSSLGSIPVNLGTPHSLTAFGDGVVSSTLGAYILDLRNASIDRISGDHYLFDRKGFFKQAASLLTSYQPHPLFHWDTNHGQYGHAESMTFALGPTGSGINFHYHKDGWNEVLFGRKRWFLYPPTVGAPPGGYNQFEAALRWFESTYDALDEAQRPWECMQYPGEVFYVPEDWYHATINIGETVAVVGQASMPVEGTMMYHVYAGLDYGDRKDRKQSLAHFGEALKVAPNHPQIFNYYGNHYKSHNEHQTAAEFYRKAVASNPKYSMAWLSLGQTLALLERFDEAYDALLHSYDLNPLYHETALELGNVAYFQNQLTTAAQWLAKATELGKEEKRTNAFINLCSMYIALERREDCLALAERRLVQFPREWYMWTVYAQALGQLGRRGEAKGILRDVIQRNGGDFPPARQVLAHIEEEEEEEITRRGLAEPDTAEAEALREVGMDEKLRQLKAADPQATGAPSAAPTGRGGAGEKVKVKVEVGRRTSASTPSSSPSLRPNTPPVYVDGAVSTAAEVRVLKLVTSYDLAVLFPSTIRRVPLQPSLITVPPVLNDPVMPAFVGGTASQARKRQEECRQYMETRAGATPFAVQVFNSWMKSTQGRLYGEMTLHAITPHQQGDRGQRAAGDSEEDVVYAGWDGLVWTPSHFFAYERYCVAGHHCTLEEMAAMALLQETPANSSTGVKAHLTVPSLATFTGAVFHARVARIPTPYRFPLGIMNTHVEKSSTTFEKRLSSPPDLKDNARVYPLPVGEHLRTLAAEVEPRCAGGRLERHHYPALVTVDQFMSGVNYAHFVTEILPKLAVLATAPGSPLQTEGAYLLVQPQGFVPEILHALGIANASVLYTHPCVLHSADVVYQFTPLPLDMPTRETIGMIRRTFDLPAERGARVHRPDGSDAEAAKAGQGEAAEAKRALLGGSGPLLLSLFRPHPLPRSVANFGEVAAVLGRAFPRLQVVHFDPADYTFSEAMSLFSRAAVVVGTVGAGFANLAFAPLYPPPLVLQVLPTITHRRIPCGVTPWWQYAEVLEMPTRFLTVEGMDFEASGWELPIAELQKFINAHKDLVVYT